MKFERRKGERKSPVEGCPHIIDIHIIYLKHFDIFIKKKVYENLNIHVLNLNLVTCCTDYAVLEM